LVGWSLDSVTFPFVILIHLASTGSMLIRPESSGGVVEGKLAEVTVDAIDIALYPNQADQTLSHSGRTVLPLAAKFVGFDCLTGGT
jgi:hypothetical protein